MSEKTAAKSHWPLDTFGVACAVVAAVLLAGAVAVFSVYDGCHISCDASDLTKPGAVGSAALFWVPALLLLTVAIEAFRRAAYGAARGHARSVIAGAFWGALLIPPIAGTDELMYETDWWWLVVALALATWVLLLRATARRLNR
jgi:hypothetical protein